MSIYKNENGTPFEYTRGGGSSGSTSDYPDLTNKPQIEGITLLGDKSASDLGLATDDAIADIVNVYGAKNLLSYPYYETTKTQNGITFTDNADGTVSGIPFPIGDIMNLAYNSANVIGVLFQTNGNLRIRAFSTLAANTEVDASFTYIAKQ